MRAFLQDKFGTSSIAHVDDVELKNILEGKPLLMRTKYRKAVANGGGKPLIKKDETYRKEHLMASSFEKSQRNIKYGFKCLFMSVSEACGELKVTVLNQSKKAGVVGCRTLNDTASSPEDYGHKDDQITFTDGQESADFFVSIVNDDSFEPDEDFLIELYDPNSKKKLEGRDTQVRITILDDDKPGKIVFENPRTR